MYTLLHLTGSEGTSSKFDRGTSLELVFLKILYINRSLPSFRHAVSSFLFVCNTTCVSVRARARVYVRVKMLPKHLRLRRNFEYEF